MTSELAIPVDISGGRNMMSAAVFDSSGPAATANTLSDADIRAIFRLRRTIEPDLAARSAVLLAESDLARLERQLELVSLATTSPEVLGTAFTSFYLGLLHPAATNSELLAVKLLLNGTCTHLKARLSPHWARAAKAIPYAQWTSELFDHVRSGDPEAAKAGVLEFINRIESLALLFTISNVA